MITIDLEFAFNVLVKSVIQFTIQHTYTLLTLKNYIHKKYNKKCHEN